MALASVEKPSRRKKKRMGVGHTKETRFSVGWCGAYV